ncbi:Tripeptidyl-peptidase 1 [Diplonema papillatum]|nr:Tripeptidyl-peptidase 1 [Diplonema papillatum]
MTFSSQTTMSVLRMRSSCSLVIPSSVAFAALLVAASAELTQVHKPATIPQGWTVEDGEVPKGYRFKVHIGMQRSNQAKLSAMVSDVSNPQGSRYLQYPTYEEMGDLVRPPKENTQKVLSWLASHGAAVEAVHPHGDYIHAAATVEQIEAMAHGKFVRYIHANLGSIIRLTSGVHVDSDVAAVIDTFSGFNGFPLPYNKKNVQKSAVDVDAVVSPTSFRSTYGITPLPAGSQRNIQAVAQFQGGGVAASDLNEFCHQYNNGTQCTISKFIGDNDIGGIETPLDTEYIMSIGNRTETWLFSYPNLDFCTDLGAFGSAVTSESTYPYTLSVSYGIQKIDFCDSAITTRFAADVEKMSGMGITVLFSSGDDGSGDADNNGKMSPSFPASVPHCVAVGGTFFVNGKDGEEQATKLFGSGGGFSYDFPVQDYQKDAVAAYLKNVTLPKAEYAQNGRGSPDVSALAERYQVVANNATTLVAGTSCSAPAFAGIVSLLNSVCLAAGGKSLGFLNPLLYQNPGMFTDVTKGTNANGGNKAGWEAIKGWDAVTGLGTANFPAMVSVVRAACAKAARNQ